MAQEVLRQRGIQSRVMADDAGGMNPSISAIKGVELLVEEEDLSLARDSLYLITD